MVQMAVVLGATSPATLAEMAWPLAFAGAVSLIYGGIFMLRAAQSPLSPDLDRGRAFSLRTAGLLAATMGAVSFIAAALDARFGRAGLMTAAGLAGFADTHSPSVAIAALQASGKIAPHATVVPILLAMSSNTLSKIALAITSGGRTYATQVVPGQLLTITAAWLGAAI
jgi:uncharacterized membrane protein (DUF4010 family)